MDRLTARCLALVLLLLAASHGDAATIRGVPSCAYWLRDREPAGGASYFNAMWLVGYLSGAAVHSEKDVLRGIDSESIAAWMDRYCKANSSKNIAEGGEALFDELAGRAPPDHRTAPPEVAALSHRAAPPDVPAVSTADHRAAPPAARALSTIDLQPAGTAASSPPRPLEPAPSTSLAPSADPPPSPTPIPSPAAPPPSSMPTPSPTEPPPPSTPAHAQTEPPPTSSPRSSHKATAGTPPAPAKLESVDSRAAVINAEVYLPRALLLANTLPLRNSKYQFKAEQFAKASGCVRPSATLNIRTATSETFAVTCADGEALAVRCDPDCRDLQ